MQPQLVREEEKAVDVTMEEPRSSARSRLAAIRPRLRG